MSIEAKNVYFQRGNSLVIKNIQMKIDTGEILGVIGPNGSGKTTLMNLLAGDFPASSGKILYENSDIGDCALIDRAKYRSVMSQNQGITFSYSVQEIIEMGVVENIGFKTKFEVAQNLEKIICLLDLGPFKHRDIRTLSGGEQKRVHLARALAQIWEDKAYLHPRFLLLDEPTSNLDLAHEIKVLDILKAEVRKGLGVMMIFHDLNLTAQFADKVILISDGSIAAFGTPKQVFRPKILESVYHLKMAVSQTPLRVSYY